MTTTAEPYLDLGDSSDMPITAGTSTAQVWFNRGLAQCYNFNHEEAIRCFERGLAGNDSCAMLHWGIAYANGPNYNNIDSLDVASGSRSSAAAVALLPSCSELEKALITAQSALYSRGSVDRKAYAAAMEHVYDEHGANAHVAGMYAESLMNLNPWELWTKDGKQADDNTGTIVSVLESALAAHPKHAGLCHFYIHAMELSPTPEKALETANNLRNNQPDGGHLQHMPSHIDMWLGRYHEAIEANIKGVNADNKYCRVTGRNNEFYKFYRMHNYHFLVWCAMFTGKYDMAHMYASEMVKQLDEEAVQCKLDDFEFGATYLESYSSILFHVFIRFGKWETILEQPLRDRVLYPGAFGMQKYARGIAYAASGRVEEAEREEKELLEHLHSGALNTRRMSNNLMFDADGGASVMAVALSMLRGEIEYRKANYDEAYEHLREAVRREESLVYDEPWGWMQPTRHALGALLAEQSHFEEAEAVFRKDLDLWKKNVWSLLGLVGILKKQNKMDGDFSELESMLREALTHCDTIPIAACYCANRSKNTCCSHAE